MEGMEDVINESMFEFAHIVNSLVKRGWELGEVKYSERRLGIGPSMKIKKESEVVNCYSYVDIKSVLDRELEKEWQNASSQGK